MLHQDPRLRVRGRARRGDADLFRDSDVYEAIDEALDGGGVINVYTRSNFGMAFHTFWRDFLASLDNRTTVVVIGDARNNYNDPRAWCLREIHARPRTWSGSIRRRPEPGASATA